MTKIKEKKQKRNSKRSPKHMKCFLIRKNVRPMINLVQPHSSKAVQVLVDLLGKAAILLVGREVSMDHLRIHIQQVADRMEALILEDFQTHLISLSNFLEAPPLLVGSNVVLYIPSL